MTEFETIIQEIKSADEWYIFGAGIVAFNTYLAIKSQYHISPNAFIVTRHNHSEKFIEGENVLLLAEAAGRIRDEEAIVLIATPEVYHQEIGQALSESGMMKYIPLDAELEYRIMAGYLKEELHIQTVEDLEKKDTGFAGRRSREAVIYMAKSQFDRKLTRQYDLPGYIEPIQVGAALSDRDLAQVRDDQGDNISVKNRNYSELTATYWVWKNARHTYKGICHYRRIFDISEELLQAIEANCVDAVLPLPFICRHDMSDQYLRYVSREDVDSFFEALESEAGESAAGIREVLKGRYIYNYNMLLARENVFDEYCGFLFSVLGRMEQIVEKKGAVRNDRYLGYFGEILTSVFFIRNRKRLKIAHAKKIWMV